MLESGEREILNDSNRGSGDVEDWEIDWFEHTSSYADRFLIQTKVVELTKDEVREMLPSVNDLED